jgi:hypothetical protein
MRSRIADDPDAPDEERTVIVLAPALAGGWENHRGHRGHRNVCAAQYGTASSLQRCNASVPEVRPVNRCLAGSAAHTQRSPHWPAPKQPDWFSENPVQQATRYAMQKPDSMGPNDSKGPDHFDAPDDRDHPDPADPDGPDLDDPDYFDEPGDPNPFGDPDYPKDPDDPDYYDPHGHKDPDDPDYYDPHGPKDPDDLDYYDPNYPDALTRGRPFTRTIVGKLARP